MFLNFPINRYGGLKPPPPLNFRNYILYSYFSCPPNFNKICAIGSIIEVAIIHLKFQKLIDYLILVVCF